MADGETRTYSDFDASSFNVLACPECRDVTPFRIFRIAVTSSALLTEDGVADFDGAEWTDDSACSCGTCGHRGVVRDFRR